MPLPSWPAEALRGPEASYICAEEEKAGLRDKDEPPPGVGWAGVGSLPAPLLQAPGQGFPSTGSRPHQLILGWGFPKPSG